MQKLHWEKISAKLKLIVMVGIFIVCAGIFFYVQYASAATRTWDGGGGDGLWSTCTNWSGDLCPGAGDIATFDGSTTTDSFIDPSFAGSVAGIDINTGYTGTIYQQRNVTIGGSDYNQAAGTFVQGTTTFDVNNNFILSGGTFMTGVGTSTIYRNFTVAGGSYVASSTSVITFDSNNISVDPVLTCSGVLDGLINIATTYVYADFFLASGCEATTVDTTFVSGSVTNNGTLHLGTNVDFSNRYGYVNNGTTTFAGTDLYTRGSFTQNGTFDLTGKTVHFDSNEINTYPTLSCSGPLGGLINIATVHVYALFTLAAGCEATTTDSTVAAGTVNNNGTLHLGTNVDFNSYGGFHNYGTTTFAGTDLYTRGSFTQNGTFDLTGKTVHFDSSDINTYPTLNCSGPLGGLINIATVHVYALFTLAAGCEATTTDSTVAAGTVTNNGILHFGTNVDLNSFGGFVNTGTTTFSGTDFYIKGSFNQSGVFDLTGKTIHFDSDRNEADPTLTCSGPLGGLINIATVHVYAFFTLAAGCEATTTTSVASGDLALYGTLTSVGTSLTARSITVANGATFRLQNTENLTAPILNTGSTVEYYGSGVYTSLKAGTAYSSVIFSNGTYNLTSNLSISGDFTNSGATFNQTGGTATFTGTQNTITGDSTFYNLLKNVTATSTLFFEANSTTTVGGTLDLRGIDSGNLYMKSTATGTEYYIDMTSLRTLEYLYLRDANNIDPSVVYCDTGCTDDGNNTNILFTSDPTGGARVWDGGGGDTNWSTCANWTFDACPTNADTVWFDDTSVKNSTIDASASSTYEKLTVNSTYSGIITANRSLKFTDGGLSLDGGTFVAPATTLTTDNFSHTGGVFTHNSGEVVFAGTGVATTSASTVFNDFAVGYEGYDDSLAAIWKLDESVASNSVLDESVNSFSGTAYGSGGANNLPQPDSDKPSEISFTNPYSKDFDGTDDYISFGNIDLPDGYEDRTLTAWAKADSTASGFDWIVAYGNPTGSNAMFLGRNGTTLYGGAYINDLTSGSKWDTTTWHHIALTYDGTTARLYWDGSEVSSGAKGWNLVKNRVYIGRQVNNGEYWDGGIDDVRVYSSALSAADVLILANGGQYTDFAYADVAIVGNTLDIDGTLTISPNSTLDTSLTNCSGAPCNIEVAGNWTNYGTFTPRTGTVTLDGTTQTLTGSTTFYNLTKTVSSADTLTFEAGSLQSVTGILQLTGVAGNLLSLVSSVADSVWYLNPTGSQVLEYLSIKDSTNTAPGTLVPSNSTNAGNNTKWYFYTPPVGDGSTGGTFLRAGIHLLGNIFLR